MGAPAAGALQLASIDVRAGAAMESQSGLQMMRPRIWGAFREPARVDRAGATAAIVMHPASNFMGHYLIEPLAQRGVACMGLNSRYVNNDATLIMERVIQDLGAGVRFWRELGYRRVVLIGNSGGAALSAFYQAQAERLTASHTVDGTATGLDASDLPPVDAIALCAAHAGRSRLFGEWIDPAVIDENDPVATDPALDMFDQGNGPPYAPAFLARFRAAQLARRERIEGWVWSTLRRLRRDTGGPRDRAFVVHRTHADPRFLDLSLDPNERRAGSVWGDPCAVNRAANAMGRFTTLTAFLSQWSSASQADGPDNLARTSVPVLHLTYRADQSVFPSTVTAWMRAGGERIRNVDIAGADHYLTGRPDLVQAVADHLAEFARLG